ncbi:AMP-binding protein [Streptomyces bottropensis]|uniref:AMP-binding protein n=1 Tax=Streptomyces bottropensis TaxID=42235 RepID=UPI0036B1D47B
MSLWGSIAETAVSSPNQIAYAGVGGEYTYDELLSDVADLSRRIEELTPRDHVVAVRGQRGYGTLTCLLACLATGRVYLPVDERWPPHRVDLVLSEAGASVQWEVEGDGKPHVAATYATGTAAPRPGLGYIIFTSGSTGVPKGVMVEEDVLAQRIGALTPLLPDGRTARFVLNTSISFDISLVELLLPLLAGGTVICPPPLTLDPSGFVEFLTRYGATHLQVTPSFFKLTEVFGLSLPTDLEVWCGGEVLDPGLGARLVARFRTVRNFYGPTEATIWCTYHTLSPDSLTSVGRPFGGTEVMAPGADARNPGELILTGAGLAAGYLRVADEAGRFIDSTEYGRAYRTGDLGWLSPDGSVHVSGRIDHQVKINGYRMELSEVESAVEDHPAVQQCAAFLLSDSDGSAQLAVAYVARESVAVRALRNHLRGTLPSYAIPQHLRQVDALPLTTAGKVDRQLLREAWQEAS